MTSVCGPDLSSPGWRIEQKYSNKVLVGNWVEERHEFMKSREGTAKSCHRIDYTPFPYSKPDAIVTRSIVKRLEGLPKKLLMNYPGECYSKNLVSQYDDNFIRHGNSTLPPLRHWDRQNQGWIPEKSDFPIREPPTNFGLLQEKSKQWRPKPCEDLRSVYTDSYMEPPRSAMCFPRFAVAPRILSSTMHPANNLNKDLDFKTQHCFQVPDHGIKVISEALPLSSTS
ncbi:cilia- and flagella-associated protein 107 [Ambystoma mexicanum]|uniref:cilia- and flagella-associated protein 107 n=1 Tax=Ambystoma mexicanum TaxID=8296 RepID=UPI0037E8E4E9